MVATPTPIEVFCSYAREDEDWLRKLEIHVSLLQRQGLLSLWHDRLISPGTNWTQAIDSRLEAASVILLLVSADFFASDYCYGIEMQRALERQEAGEARVIPIVVRPVDWKDAPFAHLHALPTDARPLATWRNRDTALADVVAGIRRVIVEELPQLSVRASRPALPQIWGIPYPRNPFFLGRESELAQVRHSLHAGGQTPALSQPQAISGLGGIGKTQLALEYAYQYSQDYTAVLWARADSAETLIASYVALAALLRLPEHKAKEQEIMVQAVKAWLQTHRDWLLVLDNADELATLPDFLPPTLGGHLLLTTRAQATGRLAHHIDIETLSPERGALLLLRRSGLIPPDAPLEQASPGEQALAIQMSRELGGLPLALDQAGAYLEETGTHLAEYWQLYQQYRADLLRERRGGFVADHPLPVATAWSVSFQRIKERNPGAAELLRLLAWLPADTVAQEMLSAGAAFLGPVLAPIAGNGMMLNQAIEALRAYSLVRRDPRAQMLSMHRLVQAVLRDQQDPVECQIWAERAVRAINAAFPHVEYGVWAQCERLLPLVLAVAERIQQQQMTFVEEAGRLLFETASYLYDRARYAEAEPLYQQAVHIREQQLGPEHPDVACSLNGLASLYYQQGKYGEAEPLLLRAMHIREQQLGPEHPDVARSLNNLAGLSSQQGKYAEAEPLYQRAVHIWEQQRGPEHPDGAHSLTGLAILYSKQDKYAEAEPLLQRAVHIWEQQLGPEHPDVAYSLNNLAEFYREQGKYGEAEPLLRRALHIWEQQLGPEHPDVAYPLSGLAELYYEQGKYGEAEPLYQRTVCIWEHQWGPEHPNLASPLTGLANLYREQGKYAEAEPLYQRALHIREQQVGPEHPEAAEIIHDLATFEEMQGNRQEALLLYQRALLIREQVLGPEHPKTRATHQRLTALRQAVSQEAVAPPQDAPLSGKERAERVMHRSKGRSPLQKRAS